MPHVVPSNPMKNPSVGEPLYSPMRWCELALPAAAVAPVNEAVK